VANIKKGISHPPPNIQRVKTLLKGQVGLARFPELFTGQCCCSGADVIHEAVFEYCEWANPPHPYLQGSDAVRLARPQGKNGCIYDFFLHLAFFIDQHLFEREGWAGQVSRCGDICASASAYPHTRLKSELLYFLRSAL